MAGRKFICACCKGSFESSWSEADALSEYQETFTEEMRAFGEAPPVSVCDDCYNLMMAESPPTQKMFEEMKRSRSR